MTHKIPAMFACVFMACILAILPGFALAALQDGVYQDMGKGYHGDLVVTVTIRDGRIIDIKGISIAATADEFLPSVLKELVPLIVEGNRLDGIDASSGATFSTNGFFEAMRGVWIQAGGE